MNILEELRSLDPRDPGRWPLPVLAGAVAIAFLVLSGAGIYMLVWNEQRPRLEQFAAEEQKLRQEFREKHSKAVNLELYKQQLKDIERSFGALLRQLPGSTEVPSLLVDISQTGLAAGLQEKLFQPQGEQKRDFYAELPIKIRLTGSYHQFGEFVSGIAALPRIVTLHDIDIKSGQQGRLRPAVARGHGEDLPLPRRGRDRRREADKKKAATPNRPKPAVRAEVNERHNAVTILCTSSPPTCIPARLRSARRPAATRCSPPARAGRRAGALHRRHQEAAGRSRRAAAGDQAVRVVRLRPDAAALAVPAERAGLGRGAGGVRPDARRNREFLEGFSLDTLKMVGTLHLGGRIYGLVQTKDGLIHRVALGNYVGQNDGKVSDVTHRKSLSSRSCRMAWAGTWSARLPSRSEITDLPGVVGMNANIGPVIAAPRARSVGFGFAARTSSPWLPPARRSRRVSSTGLSRSTSRRSRASRSS